MTETDRLEPFFEAARQARPEPDAALMARIAAEAAQETARRQAEAADATRAPRGGFAQGWRLLGGWGAFAGLATAALAGVWIGAAAPAPLEALWPAAAESAEPDLTELMPGFVAFGGWEG